jgi:hypothetical protein
MYQPIKMELSRALAHGELPFWSNRFCLGVPLVAESHVAAFYPLNWFFYRIWDVATAYRLMMWLHFIALPITTYIYARSLAITAPGAALAAISFSLCGFQAIHSPHEPFYHLMPYLPLCLYLADRYARTGQLAALAGLGVAWGLQLTLGHFQIQMWTGALAALVGSWRILTQAGPKFRKFWRIWSLGLGLCWGLLIASPQLALTWELTRYSTFFRPAQFLSTYLFPTSHWAQFALPEVYLGQPNGAGDQYWDLHRTTSGEACAYVGIVPLILACIGFAASRRDTMFRPWRLLLVVSFVLATMAEWWPDAYFLLLQLPGLGWFRAPARYTLLSSLALALLAGRGLDLSLSPQRFRTGLILALVVGGSAWAWAVSCALNPAFQAGMGHQTLAVRFLSAAVFWILGLSAVYAWRQNWVGPWTLVALTSIQLGGLFFFGPTTWRWEIRLPEASPMLRYVAKLSDIGLVGGRLLNLPVLSGQTVAYPNLGITPPPPNYLLESATLPPGHNTSYEELWQRRFGVSHGVWGANDDIGGSEVIATIDDPFLDQVMSSVPLLRRNGLGPWKFVRNSGAFPAAWVARSAREAPGWGYLYSELSAHAFPDLAWTIVEDKIPPLPLPTAQKARVRTYDGQVATVEHDGSCFLIIRRTYYPGWTSQVNDGPELPILKLNGGIQGVLLTGSGTSHISFRYRPTDLPRAVRIAAGALLVALLTMGASSLRFLARSRSRTTSPV